jgi:hypothetical protein
MDDNPGSPLAIRRCMYLAGEKSSCLTSLPYNIATARILSGSAATLEESSQSKSWSWRNSSGGVMSRRLARSPARLLQSRMSVTAAKGRWSPNWTGVTLHVSNVSSFSGIPDQSSTAAGKNGRFTTSVSDEMELRSWRGNN